MERDCENGIDRLSHWKKKCCKFSHRYFTLSCIPIVMHKLVLYINQNAKIVI